MEEKFISENTSKSFTNSFNNKKIVKVMVFGTFDIFHQGHRNFFLQAREYGNFLISVIARDKTVRMVKKQIPLNSEQERMIAVEKSGLADEVVLGNISDKYEIIRQKRPDVICLGYDQKFFVEKLEKKLDYFGLKSRIVKLKPYKEDKYKSSKLRKIMEKNKLT